MQIAIVLAGALFAFSACRTPPPRETNPACARVDAPPARLFDPGPGRAVND